MNIKIPMSIFSDMSPDEINKNCEVLRRGCDVINSKLVLIITKKELRRYVDLNSLSIKDVCYSMRPIEIADEVIVQIKIKQKRILL